MVVSLLLLLAFIDIIYSIALKILGITYFLIKSSDFKIKLPWRKKGTAKKD
jgi:hypothetical protein